MYEIIRVMDAFQKRKFNRFFLIKFQHPKRWQMTFVGVVLLVGLGLGLTTIGHTRSNQRILIVSLAKSGSSALFFSIKEKLSKEAVSFFDARTLNQAVFIESRDVLINVKFHRLGTRPFQDKHLDQFEKKIFLARDPRDILVSAFIYKSAYMGFARDPILREEFLVALRKKEEDPKSISLKQLYELRTKLKAQARFRPSISEMMQKDQEPEYYAEAIEFMDRRKDFHIFKYEQYVDEDFEVINQYLGLKLENKPDLGNMKHLARTKRYGNWRQWFTAEDVEYFRPIVKPYMDRFGYSDEWELDKNPIIEPANCSEYFKKLIKM